MVNVDFGTLDNDSSLEVISMSNVGLESLDGIARAQNLHRLIASNNKIVGSFPSELLQMKNLIEILLSGNLLNGSLPSTLNKLSGLQHLLLQGNAFTGQIPTEIGELTQIKELVLSENFISGSIPSEVAKLPGLERFSARAQRGVRQIDGNLPDFSSAKRLWYVFNCFHRV
jgi:Leucine-rich repeat (LRR) protein